MPFDFISFSPLIPREAFIALAIITLVLSVYGLIKAPRGGVFRLIAAAALLGLLGQPALRDETRTSLPNISIIIKDLSASQELDDRNIATQEAANALKQRLARFTNMDIREAVVTGIEETNIREALSFALSDVPRNQLSSIFILSDGQVSNAPETAAELGITAPVHLLLTGQKDETDRRIEIISAPRFGIVNETIDIKLKVVDTGNGRATANAILRLDGENVVTQKVKVGEELTLTAPLTRPGETVIEVTVDTLENELTDRNNRAAIQITAIRDRLRVLLVSGEPHAGERVWRNLLKSDPAVDLIHFTILKPYEKTAVARQQDLALIQFPEDELFLKKLNEFDVLIFDRYTYRRVLTPLHFENISRYVEDGGAILISAGPEFTGDKSIAAQRNLAYILPATPEGDAIESPFVPAISEEGARHPVTRDLAKETSATEWGRWLRTMPVEKRRGNVLLDGGLGAPLLIVDRVGDGRVGLLLSDHVWLWARNFDGGGPHRELLRRMVHWLMKEPELEEEALRADISSTASGGTLTLIRRTMAENIAPIIVTAPDGTRQQVTLSPQGPGQWQGGLQISAPGLYRAETTTQDTQSEDEAATRTLFAVASLGLAAPPEFDIVTQTDEKLRPLVEASQGGVYPVRRASRLTVPSLRLITPGKNGTRKSTTPAGNDRSWAGIYRRNASRLDMITSKPLAPPLAWLFLIGLTILGAWLLEGRGFNSKQPQK